MSSKDSALLSNTIASAVAQKNVLTIRFKDGKTFSIDNSQPTFKKLKVALKAKNGVAARKLINAAESIRVWAVGKLTIDKSDNVLYDGQIVDPKMHTRILQMVRENADVTNLVHFLDNLYKNPSVEAISDLYEFLITNELPITEDGCFLAFKSIGSDYKSMSSRGPKLDNHVGKIVKMNRADCQLDRNETCSTGLHFCRHSYVSVMGGSRTILVKINPKDVTSIPTDYNQSKGRCCEYKVVAELKEGTDLSKVFKKATTKTTQLSRNRSVKPAEKKVAKKTVKKVLTPEQKEKKNASARARRAAKR